MIDLLTDIVRQAGQLTLKYFETAGALEVEFKNPLDLVTNADSEVEEFMKTALAEAFPDIAFFGEETGVSDAGAQGMFIVDPIDGTTNFFHGYPLYSVSLGYRHAGRTEAGVVYCPPLDQMFAAVRGQGATLNGKRIRVSATDTLKNALATTGFACVRGGLERDSVPIHSHMIYQVRDIHRDGTAALDLCYVAAGKYDLYWEYNLSPWDIAAGVLILEEAGGRVTDFAGQGDFEQKRELVATNGKLHKAFLTELQDLGVPPTPAGAVGS